MVSSTYADGQDISDLRMHVSAIATFLRQHEWLWRSHVVDFFKKKLWEQVDDQWNCCLRVASPENWLLLPSGVVKEEWPNSLKEFVQTACELSLSRTQADNSSTMFYSGVPQVPIGNVLRQGMSVKKLHEIGALAALIAGIAKASGAKYVVDVGAGQGYLALVLAFEYRLSVIAVDACAHHADVTNKRALRIEKYYNSRSRKPQPEEGEGLKHDPEVVVHAPQTVTCHIGGTTTKEEESSSSSSPSSSSSSSATLSSLLSALNNKSQNQNSSKAKDMVRIADDHNEINGIVEAKDKDPDPDPDPDPDRCVVLAGLHACGDLSATMLRTFVECKDVAALINVTCCYHLLTEEARVDTRLPGFPMSEAVGHLGLQLGRSVRELACESADRWKEHHPTKAVQNFELHAFRAAFQLILDRHYPEFATSRPSVGRVGKSRRRRKARQSAMEPLIERSLGCEHRGERRGERDETTSHVVHDSEANPDPCEREIKNILNLDLSVSSGASVDSVAFEQQLARFEEYVRPVLELFNLPPLPMAQVRSIWAEVAPHQDLVGPFYSLRTVLAPVLESFILLDRLLYLKEQAAAQTITAALLPIFEPSMSPRNMAIVACRGGFERSFRTTSSMKQ